MRNLIIDDFGINGLWRISEMKFLMTSGEDNRFESIFNLYYLNDANISNNIFYKNICRKVYCGLNYLNIRDIINNILF